MPIVNEGDLEFEIPGDPSQRDPSYLQGRDIPVRRESWRELQERLDREAWEARERAGDSAQNQREWLPPPATAAPAPRPEVPPVPTPPGGRTLPFIGAPSGGGLLPTPRAPISGDRRIEYAQAPAGGGAPLAGEPSPGVPAGSGFSDIDELRAEPWSTEFEQQALARADELVGERYNVMRQRRAMEMARQGMDPRSKFYQSQMAKVDQDQARELSNFRRDLQLKKVSERERRLAAARGVEYSLDQQERQRLMDILAMISGDPNYTMGASGIAQSLAQLFGQQQALATQQSGESFGNLGDLFGMLLAQQNQQQQPTY